jgi:hypothetical protein
MYYKVQYNDMFFVVNNINNEPINIFYDRWYFIIKYLLNNKNIDFHDIENLSYIYVNIKYYQCKYPLQIFKKIETYL